MKKVSATIPKVSVKWNGKRVLYVRNVDDKRAKLVITFSNYNQLKSAVGVMTTIFEEGALGNSLGRSLRKLNWKLNST